MPNLRVLVAAALGAAASVVLPMPAEAGYSDRPGDFDYYALVLSWSPSFCLSGNGSHANDPQCTSSRPYAFVLHGLWPQFDKGWPESCSTDGQTTLPFMAVRSMLDIMPSEKLVQHEYEKHGTCSGLSADGYLSLARKLFTSIKVPANYTNLASPLQVSLTSLRQDFLSANPALNAGMVAIDCAKDGALREIHICFSKDGAPTACGRNENQDKMCRQEMVTLPPVRARAGGTYDASPSQGSSANSSNGSSGITGNSGYYTKKRHHRHHTSIFGY